MPRDEPPTSTSPSDGSTASRGTMQRAGEDDGEGQLGPPRLRSNVTPRLSPPYTARRPEGRANPGRAIGAGARPLLMHNIRHFPSGEGLRIVRLGTLTEEAQAWLN